MDSDTITSPRRLQRQPSCACLPLDVVGSWCGSGRAGSARFARLQHSDDDEGWYAWEEELARAPSQSLARGQQQQQRRRRPPRWSSYPGTRQLRRLWRRIVREKGSIVNPAKKGAPLGYDAQAYAQNFDEGAAWAEPENLSRSFSARFAVPSRVLRELS